MLGLSSPTNPRLSNYPFPSTPVRHSKVVFEAQTTSTDPSKDRVVSSSSRALQGTLGSVGLDEGFVNYCVAHHVEAGFEAGLITGIFGILLVKASKLSLTASSWHGRQAPRIQARMQE